MSATDEIQQFLLKKLDETPAGMRYADLFKSIRLEFPTMKYGTVTGGIRRSYQRNTKLIYKPEKGLFRLLKYQDALANADTHLLHQLQLVQHHLFLKVIFMKVLQIG
jgi:hypothetical protein